MTDYNSITRPKWLKFLLGLFSAWTSFILTITLIFVIIWIIQVKILEIEISGTPAFILLVIALTISIYASFRTTKWQNIYLENKSLRLNYIILIALILLSFLFVPGPMIYMMF